MGKYQKLIKQVTLFGLVGGGSLLIDLVVTTVLYDKAHVAAYIAGPIGFVSAFFFNFPINRKHVFNHTKDDKFSLRTQVTFYVCLSLFNLAMTAVMMAIFVDHLHVQVSLAKIIATGIIAVWNFLIFKFFIFSKRKVTDLEGLIIQ